MTETEETILERAENYLAALQPRLKAMDPLTLHYILNSSMAKSLMDLYDRIEEVLTIVDPLKAEGIDLEHIVSTRLLTRDLGEYATGYLTFRKNTPALQDITIPAGSRCKCGNLYFATDEEGTLESGTISISIPATAEERGTDYNVAAYTINVIYSNIGGINSVENPLAFAGGLDEETDEELRQRYIDITTLPGLATSEMIKRHIEDLDTVTEVKVINRSAGDIEVICDDSEGLSSTNTEITDELEIVMASGIQSRGCLGAIATPGGNIQPVIDPVSEENADCAGGLVWVRPTEFVLADDTFNIDYNTTSGSKVTGSVTVPIGTHRGEMVEIDLNEDEDRAVSIPSKAFTGAYNYDILIGMGVPNYLYNLPTNITFAVSIDIVLTDTPETGLDDNIKASVEAWLGDYAIGEAVEFSDMRTIVALEYEAATEMSLRHVLSTSSRPFIGIDQIRSFRISGNDQTITRDGETIELEEDEICKAGDVVVNIVT